MSNTEMTKRLMAAFPQEAIKSRPGGGNRRFEYVEAHTVIHRLIDATDNHFDVEVTKTEQIGDVFVAYVKITIPGLGSRQHIGVYKPRGAGEGEDLIKGAISDAIKKCATLFGVGLELYGPDYEHDNSNQLELAKTTPAPQPKAENTDEIKQKITAVIRKIMSKCIENGKLEWVSTPDGASLEVVREVAKTNKAALIKLIDSMVDRQADAGEFPSGVQGLADVTSVLAEIEENKS